MNICLNKFFTKLKEENIYGYIYGGRCIEYYSKEMINTIDYDISLYINDIQLKNSDTFIIIYNNLIELYNNLKYIYDILPLKKMSYSKIYLKYLPENIINTPDEYINHYIICDFIIETINHEILIDLYIKFTPDISIIKNKINSDYYVLLEEFITDYKIYYTDLCKNKLYKYSKKINIIKNRINILSNIKK